MTLLNQTRYGLLPHIFKKSPSHVYKETIWGKNVQANVWPVARYAWIVIVYLGIPLKVLTHVRKVLNCCKHVLYV